MEIIVATHPSLFFVGENKVCINPENKYSMPQLSLGINS